MHTREIQIGLRQLLGGLHASPSAELAEAGRVGVVQEADGTKAANGAEALAGRQPGADLDQVPRLVAELVQAVRTPSARRQLERLVGQAELQQPVTIDLDTAARMVRPYTWLLGRVGHEGIRLTDAGHLPPGEVAAVIGTLGLRAGRTARSPVRRENQAPAVVQLRESAQATGLVRKERGRLLRTVIGDELQSDPAGLWWHLAARMPLCSAAVSEAAPGLILLACVAARHTGTGNLDDTIAAMLTAIGWLNGDGRPLTGAAAAAATSGTHAVLRRLGALPASPDGVAFARAALSTWPGTA